MYCNTALGRAFYKKCILCDKTIGYYDYETVQTKPRKFKKVSYPAKTSYMHTACYNAAYEKNLPIRSDSQIRGLIPAHK